MLALQGRADCSPFSFLQPTLALGQIHPLNQSKLGPAPAVRLGTGFASLLQGVGAPVPSWQEGAIRAKDRMGCLGVVSFLVPFRQPGCAPGVTQGGT